MMVRQPRGLGLILSLEFGVVWTPVYARETDSACIAREVRHRADVHDAYVGYCTRTLVLDCIHFKIKVGTRLDN